MSGPFGNAATFLVETVFGLYLLIVILRFLLQLFRADFYNPISQFLVKATQPVLRPMRRYVPGFRGLDVASLLLMFAVQLVEILLIFQIHGAQFALLASLPLVLALLLDTFVDVFFYGIIIRIVLSWLNPHGPNPAMALLYSLTEPLMGPARRSMGFLTVGGLDLSPMVVLILLHLFRLLFVQPVLAAAWGLAGSG